MIQPAVIEAAGSDILDYVREHVDRRFLLIALPDAADEQRPSLRASQLAPNEQILALDALAEANRGLPDLPPEAFDRGDLYGE